MSAPPKPTWSVGTSKHVMFVKRRKGLILTVKVGTTTAQYVLIVLKRFRIACGVVKVAIVLIVLKSSCRLQTR